MQKCPGGQVNILSIKWKEILRIIFLLVSLACFKTEEIVITENNIALNLSTCKDCFG